LSEAIPGFKYRTTSLKDRISSCFEVKVFSPGYYLIKEGEKSDHAYILKKGECKIIS
jgi:CRP-like cAMP-binding protein